MPHPDHVKEIETLQILLKHSRSLAGYAIEGLDLSSVALPIDFSSLDVTGTIFLGCTFPNIETQVQLLTKGAVIFPRFENKPYNPYRHSLYTPQELMAGYENGGIENTTDYKIFNYFQQEGRDDPNIVEALARRIHDHAIDDALGEVIGDSLAARARKKIIGVMGGHSITRADPFYKKVAQLTWSLARRRYFIVSGGGPGIMEAAHLGAYLAKYEDAAVVDDAIEILKPFPDYSNASYLAAALKVTKKYPHGGQSVAIPTWFYGHEPSNYFATHIAKYFSNSIREDGLLAIALRGVVFAPGQAGTTQEIFMDAAQNHYASYGYVSPMVFLGTDWYQTQTGIYDLLCRVSKGQAYHDLLIISDDPDQLVEFIDTHEPIPPKAK